MQQWRKIYGSILDDEKLATLPIQIRWLKLGTILISDDDGRFKATPRYVKAKVFPYDDFSPEQVKNWLLILAENCLLFVYKVGGETYGQHPNWEEFNSVRKDRYLPSKLPPFTQKNNQVATTCQPNDNREKKEKKEKKEYIHSRGTIKKQKSQEEKDAYKQLSSQIAYEVEKTFRGMPAEKIPPIPYWMGFVKKVGSEKVLGLFGRLRESKNFRDIKNYREYCAAILNAK